MVGAPKLDLLEAYSSAAYAARVRSEDAARSGLTRTLSDTPVAHGYADLLGGYSQAGGAFAKAEVGYRPIEKLALFASGGYGAQDGWGVQGGLRWEW